MCTPATIFVCSAMDAHRNFRLREAHLPVTSVNVIGIVEGRKEKWEEEHISAFENCKHALALQCTLSHRDSSNRLWHSTSDTLLSRIVTLLPTVISTSHMRNKDMRCSPSYLEDSIRKKWGGLFSRRKPMLYWLPVTGWLATNDTWRLQLIITIIWSFCSTLWDWFLTSRSAPFESSYGGQCGYHGMNTYGFTYQVRTMFGQTCSDVEVHPGRWEDSWKSLVSHPKFIRSSTARRLTYCRESKEISNKKRLGAISRKEIHCVMSTEQFGF